MRATTLASAAGSSALLLCLLGSASSASAQEASRRAPLVRVSSQDGGGVASNYVTPAIDVSEDAYVFAVMMDLDGRIQVLHPDDPGISVRLRSNKQLRLPNFFAGFNAPMQSSGRYTSNGMVSHDRYERVGTDTRGTVIALASRAPFNLELIEGNGDWDISEIRRLIEYRSPSAAAQALARYLGSKGEPIGRDYMRFAGQHQNYYAYDNLAYCAYGYGFGSMGVALSFANALERSSRLPSATVRPVVIGYDACGFPVVVAAQVAPGGGIRRPVPPRQPGDTTVFPKSRLPSGIPRTPGHADSEPMTVPIGVFPLPRHAEPQMQEATMAAPDARRAEPRGASGGFRSQPVSPTLPDRRPPVERTQPQAAPVSSGMQPVYKPEPRPIERAEPVRAPERIKEQEPAPVVYDRPSAPPPPPPRAAPAPAPLPTPVKNEPATPQPRNQ